MSCRLATSPAVVQDSEIRNTIEFWGTGGRRLDTAGVRETLQCVQDRYEREIFERHWDCYGDVFDRRGLDTVIDASRYLVLDDPTREEWGRVFDHLGVEDEAMRKVVRLLHAQIGTRLVDTRDETTHPVVVHKPEWVQTAERTLRY